MVINNSNLKKAKKDKNDEFYTRLEDIEKELRYYSHHFKDKVVYCNCDDPNVSNFFKYFALNFERLGIKKLITSCYNNNDNAIWSEYTGGDYNTIEEIRVNITTHEINGDGGFKSDESIELLEESDIVVTNPPFSLFREHAAQIIDYGKDFLIIGSNNAVTYKDIFPLLKDNKIWLGYKNGAMDFDLPDGSVKAVRVNWYTNLTHSKQHEDIILWKQYKPEDYPVYDNYNAINVDRVTDIPVDYDGVMGVPITFINKHNPEQFEILGMAKSPLCYDNDEGAELIKKYVGIKQHTKEGKITPTGNVNTGPVILSDTIPDKLPYYTADNADGYLNVLYARILIKHKHRKREDDIDHVLSIKTQTN